MDQRGGFAFLPLDHGVSCGQGRRKCRPPHGRKVALCVDGIFAQSWCSGSWWKRERESVSRGRPSLFYLWENCLFSCFCGNTELCWKGGKLCMIESKGDIEDGFNVASISAGNSRC